MDLKEKIVELCRKTTTDLPKDVETALHNAFKKEENKIAKENLQIVLENVRLARFEKKPICQDTGLLNFFVKRTETFSEQELKKAIFGATKISTESVPLRQNSVDSLTEKTLGNIPLIYFEETVEQKNNLKIDLLLKGAGSENISRLYSLPNEELNAQRNLEGIEKCVLDAVFKAQGKGCPPYFLGIGVCGSSAEALLEAKKQLLRKVDDINKHNKLAVFERKLLKKINALGIGPLGLGGGTTALGVKVSFQPRHPASFFVGVSFSCWCLRRHSIG